MTTLYPIGHNHIRQTYPEVYNVFAEKKFPAPPAPNTGKGYEYFKKVAKEIKINAARNNNSSDTQRHKPVLSPQANRRPN